LHHGNSLIFYNEHFAYSVIPRSIEEDNNSFKEDSSKYLALTQVLGKKISLLKKAVE
jgi:hypothetical protein